MKRLEYISRSLSKIQHKKFELYVISRIIHKLDDPEIKYVFQQYAARDNNTGKYALIDLYLPQLGIAIEVDEAHHKETGLALVPYNPNELNRKWMHGDFVKSCTPDGKEINEEEYWDKYKWNQVE